MDSSCSSIQKKNYPNQKKKKSQQLPHPKRDLHSFKENPSNHQSLQAVKD
jgi:hypothetical protein